MPWKALLLGMVSSSSMSERSDESTFGTVVIEALGARTVPGVGLRTIGATGARIIVGQGQGQD